MDIQINYKYREADLVDLVNLEELAKLVISSEGKPDCTEVSINFVTDDEIHELNRDYRGIDRPTDVLSFECDNLDDEFPDAEDFELGDVYELGDIVIAPDIAERQAPEYGLSFADEMSLLVTHGLLHLCGYDHMQDDEAQEMEARERELLSEFWGRPFKRSAADR